MINLSSAKMNFSVADPRAQTPVEAGDACPFYIIVAGKTKVQIAGADGNGIATLEVPVTPQEASTILVTDRTSKGQVVTGEVFNYANGDASVHIVAEAGLEGYKASVKGGAGDVFPSEQLGSGTGAHSIPPGQYTVEITDASGKVAGHVDLDAQAKRAYTVGVASGKDGTLIVRQYLNNPDRRPTLAGNSKA